MQCKDEQCSDAHGCKEHRDECPIFTCSDIHHCSQSNISVIPIYETEVWQFLREDLLAFLEHPTDYKMEFHLQLNPLQR